MAWTDEQLNALECLWEWGHSSSTIATMLGCFTRNAVMGKVTREKLIGRQGIRLKSFNPRIQIKPDQLTQSARDLIDGSDPKMLANATITLAAIIVGQHAKTIANAIGVASSDAQATLDQLHETKVWLNDVPPPMHWWHHEEGNMAFILDMLVLDRRISFVEDKKTGERRYHHA